MSYLLSAFLLPSFPLRSSQTLFLATIVLCHSAWNIPNDYALACTFILNCSQLINTQPCVCFPPYPASLDFPPPCFCSDSSTAEEAGEFGLELCFLRNLGRVVFSEK